jgi:hypothetical protein
VPVATVAIYYQPLDLGQQTFRPFFFVCFILFAKKKKKKKKKRGEFRPQLWKCLLAYFNFFEVAISPGLEISRQRITFSHSLFPISLSDALSLPRNISPPTGRLCVSTLVVIVTARVDACNGSECYTVAAPTYIYIWALSAAAVSPSPLSHPNCIIAAGRC